MMNMMIFGWWCVCFRRKQVEYRCVVVLCIVFQLMSIRIFWDFHNKNAWRMLGSARQESLPRAIGNKGLLPAEDVGDAGQIAIK